MDFDERISGSSMYLPSCTYYVSGADFSALPHYLTQSQTSCPVTYPYQSAALPQVPSVREVAFRDYGIEASNKWHHSRGTLTHCYPEDRGWVSPTPRGAEILVKNSSSNISSGSSSGQAPGLPGGSLGKNGVLPQAFDQFFDSACGGSGGGGTGAPTAAQADTDTRGKTSPAPAQLSPDSAAESCSPKSACGTGEERQISEWSRGREKNRPARLLKAFICAFISVEGLWRPCRFTLEQNYVIN